MADKLTTCNCLVGEAYIDANGNCACTGNVPTNSSTIVIPRRGIIDTPASGAPIYYTHSAQGFDLFEWIKGNKWIVIGGVAALVTLFVIFKSDMFSDK